MPESEAAAKTYASTKEVQADLLEMLHVFDELCKREGFLYCPCAGTLLGAVRHKGFIPWDDDADLTMFREDYDRLLRLPPSRLPEGYYLHSMLNDKNYSYPFAKFRKKGTEFIEAGFEGLDIDRTLWVDIFPTDYCRDPHGPLVAIASAATRVSTEACRHASMRELGRPIANDSPKNRFYNLIGRGDPHAIAEWRERAIQSVAPKEVSGETWTFYACTEFLKPKRRKEYFPHVMLPFEDMELPCPQNFHAILSDVYGDYMRIPSEDERETHGA